MVVAVVAVIAVAAGSVLVWRVVGPAGESDVTGPAPGLSGTRNLAYFVTLGARAVGSIRDGVYVRITVDADTNLPEGTVAGVTWNTLTHGGDVSYGESPIVDGDPLSVVHDGVLPLVIEPGCTGLGTGFDVDVQISPDLTTLVPPNHPVDFPWPPRQPGVVLRTLGERFQNMRGDQIGVADGPHGQIHRIVLHGSYDWPPAPAGFVSHGCPYPGA